MNIKIVYGVNHYPHICEDDPYLSASGLAYAMEYSNCFPWEESIYEKTKIIIDGVEYPPPSKPITYPRNIRGKWAERRYFAAMKLCEDHVRYCIDIHKAFFENNP